MSAALAAAQAEGAQRLEDLRRAQEELTEQFRLLSHEALDRNSKRLLELTEERQRATDKTAAAELEQRRQAVAGLVKPIEEHLQRVATQIDDSERRRAEAFSTLGEQMRLMGESGSLLRRETELLKTALRRPEIRGSWGEHAAAPGGRAGRHGRVLRLQHPGDGGQRRRQAAARHDRPPGRRPALRRRLEGVDLGLPRRAERHRRDGPGGAARGARPARPHARRPAREQGVLGPGHAVPGVRHRVRARRGHARAGPGDGPLAGRVRRGQGRGAGQSAHADRHLADGCVRLEGDQARGERPAGLRRRT